MNQLDWTSDELERGYYVYVHRCNATGVAFYVGKGKGKRAYEEKRRTQDWKDFVADLEAGYTVEFANEDLTEAEAGDLERELIAKFGKRCDGTGTLVNRTDGFSLELGEGPSITFAFDLPDGIGWEERTYRQLPAEEKRAIVQELANESERWSKEWLDAEDSASVDDDDTQASSAFETDLSMEVYDAALNIQQATKHLRKRKIKYQDFANTVEDGFEDIDGELEDMTEDNEDARVVKLAREMRRFLEKCLARMK